MCANSLSGICRLLAARSSGSVAVRGQPTPAVTENAGARNTTRTIGFGVRNSAGPLYAVLTYDLIKPPVATTGPRIGIANPDEKHLQVGATGDFNVVKTHLAYARQTAILTIRPYHKT